MQPTPYLFFNGDCAEAIKAYARILDAEIVSTMAAGDMPDFPVPEDKKTWLAHAELKIGDGSLMASDNIMGESAKMQGCSVMLSFAAKSEAEAVFNALAEGGSVEMPFEPTFWSAGFGTLSDRYGVRWMIGTDEAA